jgi:hypothetical protein
MVTQDSIHTLMTLKARQENFMGSDARVELEVMRIIRRSLKIQFLANFLFTNVFIFY